MIEIAELITGILITVSIAAAIVLSLYFYYKARNKERMAMIEKGMYKFEATRKSPMRGLKFGLLLLGIGIGIFAGYIIDTYLGIVSGAAYFSMMLLFGGLSFVLSYYIEEKRYKEEK